jgi:triacylglycerol lipase
MNIPVLFVHGIDDTGALFKRMQAGLTARGFSNLLAMNITPPGGEIPLEAMAEQVQAAAKELLRASSAARLDIVAFSMGSLASRYFIQRLDGCSLVRRFIAIAGPQRGTLTAYLRNTPGARQMRPGSACLTDLNSDPDPWSPVAAYTFWTPLDLMVLPSTSALLPKASHRPFFVLLHPWMVSDPRVIAAVAETLSA